MTGTLQLPVWIAVPSGAWEHRVQIAAPFPEQKGTWAKVLLDLKHGVLLLCLICVYLVALHFSGESLRDTVGGEKKHSVLREGRDGGSKQQHSHEQSRYLPVLITARLLKGELFIRADSSSCVLRLSSAYLCTAGLCCPTLKSTCLACK